MPKRGFAEKNFYALNPMPDVTDAEVLKRAELDMIDAKERSPFMMDWKYAPGPDGEYVSLAPGDSIMLRESECRAFLTEFSELGGVIISSDATDLEHLQERTKGLSAAAKKFSEQGRKRLVDIRKGFGFGKEDMADHKYDHWAYYYNQAKADIIVDHLKELREQIAILKEKEDEDEEE